MAGYRLYFLNYAGHIVDAAEATWETDSEALEWAKRERGSRDVELWAGARIVAKIQNRQDA